MEYPSLAHKLPRKSARNRNRMSRENADLSQYARRFVENAELSQHRPPVVVDFFSSQTVVGVEGVDTAVCLPIAHLSGIPPRTEDCGDGLTAVANLPRLKRWKYVCNPKRKRNLPKSRPSEA